MAFNTTLKHFTSSQELAPLWATAQNYLLNQLVLEDDIIYRCAIAHTSSVFATDLGAGKWVAVSAAGAQGSKNYIPNGDFEDNNTTGWELFNTTIASTTKIPSGSVVSGAAGFSALSVTPSSPLAGTYSLSVSTPAGVTITTTAQGFISLPFTIDREDQAKVMGFSFYYEALSGTMDFSGTSSNTFAVYIRDVDGESWIQPAGVYNMTQSTGVGLCSGTFQTTATGTQYQIAVMMINTVGAPGVSLKFDDFQLGPQKVVYGSPVTDWESYTPTTIGGGTISSSLLQWRRVGGAIQIRGALETATITGNFTFSLPDGISIDTNLTGSSGSYHFGTGVIFNAPTFDNNVPCSFGYSNATSVRVRAIGPTNTATHNYLDLSGSFPYDGAIRIMITSLDIPVQGWSSSVQMSNDTDTRVVAFEARVTGTVNVPDDSTITLPFTSANIIKDTHSAYVSSATGYVVPVSGFYAVSVNISFPAAGSVGQRNYIAKLLKNGADYLEHLHPSATTNTNFVSLDSPAIYMQAGESFNIAAYQNDIAGSSGVNVTGYRMMISRVSGPATIAASEKIVALVSSNLTTTSPIGTGVTDIVFDAVEIDTHGIVIPGTPNSIPGSVIATKFKIPRSGYYRFSWQIRTASLTLTTSQRMYSAIAGPTDTKLGLSVIGSSAAIVTSVAYSSNGTLVEHCNSGDEFYIVATSTAATNLNGVDNDNYFCVESV